MTTISRGLISPQKSKLETVDVLVVCIAIWGYFVARPASDVAQKILTNRGLIGRVGDSRQRSDDLDYLETALAIYISFVWTSGIFHLYTYFIERENNFLPILMTVALVSFIAIPLLYKLARKIPEK